GDGRENRGDASRHRRNRKTAGGGEPRVFGEGQDEQNLRDDDKDERGCEPDDGDGNRDEYGAADDARHLLTWGSAPPLGSVARGDLFGPLRALRVSTGQATAGSLRGERNR